MPPAPICSSQLPSARLGNSILASGETFLALQERLGGPWEHQDGIEVVHHKVFIAVAVIQGLLSERFICAGVLYFLLFLGLD